MFRLIWLLLSLVQAQYTINVDQSSYAADDIILFSWTTPADNEYKLNLLNQGNIYMCTCATEGFKCFTDQPVAKNIDISESSGSTKIDVSSILSLGANGPYVFQFQAIQSTQKSVYAIAYTKNWIQFTGMTGSTKPSSQGCQVPYPQYEAVPGTGTSSTVQWPSYTLPSEYKTLTGSLLWKVPYTWQKGPTRMASAQPTPGTKVTVTVTPTRRYPTSSWSAFTTYVKTLMPYTTLTPGPEKQAIQYPNYVPTISTTPAGYKPSRNIPSISLPTEEESSTTKHKRWAKLMTPTLG